MKKTIINPRHHIALILFLFSCIVFAQAPLEKIEYERNKEKVTAYSFTVPPCHKDVIVEEWKSLSKGNGGGISLFREATGQYKADDVEFQSLHVYGPMTFYLDLFPHSGDSIIVANAFQFKDGEFIDPATSSPQTMAADQIMQDFSFSVRRGCVQYEVNEAVKYMDGLNRQVGSLQSENSSLERSIAMSHYKITKLEREVGQLKSQADFYDRKKTGNHDEFVLKKLDLESQKVKAKLSRASGNLLREKSSINEYTIRIAQNKAKIIQIKEEMKDQKIVVDDIISRLNNIKK